MNYVATCRDCDELPASPRKATAHATAKSHRITETKSYIVEPPE